MKLDANDTNLYFPLLLHVTEPTMNLRFMEIVPKKSHFSVKMLSVRKQAFHKTTIWQWDWESIMIFTSKITPRNAWIPGIQTFRRFSCRAFGNFLCSVTLKVPSISLLVHWRQAYLQGSKQNKVNKLENNHLEDLSGFEKHLYYVYSHQIHLSWQAVLLIAMQMLAE